MCTNIISFVTKVWLSCHLYDKSKEGEHEDDPGQHEGDDVETEVDVVLVAPWPRPPESEVEHAALAATHGGHGPRGYRYPTPDHPGQGDSLLVHPSPPGEENMFFQWTKIIFSFLLFFVKLRSRSIPVHSNSIFSFLHYRVSQKKDQ